MKRIPLLLLVPLFALGSCAGYRMGGIKPPSLQGVETISVSMFRNDTLHPRAEAIATSAVADAVVQDGTYRIGRPGEVDAVLEGTVRSIDYSSLRSQRFNTLRPEELTNTVRIQWVLRDAKDRKKILASGHSVGRSQLFASANLQTARNNALPEACEQAGEDLVSQLANGY